MIYGEVVAARSRKLIHYGNRFSVSAFFPSKELADVASERTEGMVGYFISCARRRDPLKWQDDLYTLARSCYLQGALDVAEVGAQMKVQEMIKPDSVN